MCNFVFTLLSVVYFKIMFFHINADHMNKKTAEFEIMHSSVRKIVSRKTIMLILFRGKKHWELDSLPWTNDFRRVIATTSVRALIQQQLWEILGNGRIFLQMSSINICQGLLSIYDRAVWYRRCKILVAQRVECAVYHRRENKKAAICMIYSYSD